MIRLTGTLRCASAEEALRVTRLLPEHSRQTLAEAGCLAFSVTPMPGGLCWAVDERFVDRAAFSAHQARTAGSVWGQETVHIPREYRMIDEDDADGSKAAP